MKIAAPSWKAAYKSTLRRLWACNPAMEHFLESKAETFEAFWESVERPDWLLWLVGRLEIDRKLLVMTACACARTALKYVKPGEERPLRAIETAERWCRGEATIDEVRKARAAADVAAYADVADAADAAAYAAVAADAAYAARTKARKEMAVIVRQHIPADMIWKRILETL